MSRIIFFALLIAVAIGLQIRMQESAGWTVEFALAALIACSSWTSWSEHLALVAFAVFLMNWTPVVTFDLALFAALPILAFAFRATIPWQRAVANVAVTAVAAALFMVGISGTLAVAGTALFLKDLGGTVAFGAALFAFIEAVYEPGANGRRALSRLPL